MTQETLQATAVAAHRDRVWAALDAPLRSVGVVLDVLFDIITRITATLAFEGARVAHKVLHGQLVAARRSLP